LAALFVIDNLRNHGLKPVALACRFAAAFEFARELSQAKDMQDFIRIHTEYIQKCLQSFFAQARDFAETYINAASGKIRAPSLYSLE